jgi:threonine/homoserine/homoserine lactone efflux protein
MANDQDICNTNSAIIGYRCAMTHELFVALTLFAFISSVTPGPNNLMLMASGINFGFQRTIPHMLGVSIGFTAMIWLVGAGIAQVFVAFPFTYTLLKWASIVYLVYLAWKIATAAPPADSEPDDANRKPMTFTQAALFQWVNPKAWTMALTAVAVYVPTGSASQSLLVVALVFGLINLPTVSAWAYLGVQLRRLLHRPNYLRAFNITAAVLLLVSLYPVLTDHSHGI